jgi:type I restriction enzyme, S subunit
MEKNGLPKGWVEVRLDDIVLRSSEKVTPQKGKSEEMYYVGLEHIEKGTRQIIGAEVIEFTATKNAFKKGDLLYGKLRPYLNKVTLAQRDGVCSTDILVYKTPNYTTASFLVYFMSSREFVNETSANTSGINLPRVSTKFLSNFPIPPPSPSSTASSPK